MLEGLRYVYVVFARSYHPMLTCSSRLSYGVSTRLARIAPDRTLQYKEWSIPAGVSFLR